MRLAFRRRGAFLAIFGAIHLLYGIRLFAVPDDRWRAVPLWGFWGWLWLASAIVAFVNAFRRSDRWGFVALQVAAVGWGPWVLLHGALLGDAAVVPNGLAFVLFGAITGVVQGWPEVPRHAR